MTGPMIEIKDLQKAYGTRTVLTGINLSVTRGEVVAVIGPSGSEKSTFLRCLNRLESPTSGRIIIDGIEMTNDKALLRRMRRSVGMVFQSFNLFPHMSALANVMEAPVTVLWD